MIPNNRFYTAEETAKILNVHVNTVYNMIHDGRLEYYQVGRRKRISAEQIEAMVKTPAQAEWEELKRRIMEADEEELQRIAEAIQTVIKDGEPV